MGYSEIPCRLCGVSFNIGRRRLRSEPMSMGWSCTGDYLAVGCQREVNSGSLDACGEDGEIDTEDADKDREDEAAAGIEMEVENLMNGGGDEDYVYEESDGDEVLEFESDGGTLDEEECDAMDIDSVTSGGDTYGIFKDNLCDSQREHRCSCRGEGYNGEVITAEEMRGCTTAQCIISKAHHQGATREEPDDHDFERGGRYCLTGLCGHVCSGDCGGETFVPARHGVGDSFVGTLHWNGSGDTAHPFHPACFDIFSRLSRKQFGYVNFEALGNWCLNENNWHSAYNCSSDRNVLLSSSQWWEYHDGCEYLAANPLLIPGLTPILQNAIQEDSGFNPQAGAFDVPFHSGQCDSFNNLPLELRLQILSYVDSPDIANLLLASRTFRQLPISLWRDLLLKDMPWLWEVWSDDLPYIWATTTYEAVAKHEKMNEERQAWRSRVGAIIKEELPEIFDAWDADVEQLLSENDGFLESERSEALSKMVTKLPATKTNWYKLYSEITRNWKDLRGLQNRKRVWKDIGVIVEKLDKYTET